MGIDHGRADIAMPEHLLDGPNVIIGLEQMAGKRMVARMIFESLQAAKKTRMPTNQTDSLSPERLGNVCKKSIRHETPAVSN
jgi:hypothetical protein